MSMVCKIYVSFIVPVLIYYNANIKKELLQLIN